MFNDECINNSYFIIKIYTVGTAFKEIHTLPKYISSKVQQFFTFITVTVSQQGMTTASVIISLQMRHNNSSGIGSSSSEDDDGSSGKKVVFLFLPNCICFSVKVVSRSVLTLLWKSISRYLYILLYNSGNL